MSACQGDTPVTLQMRSPAPTPIMLRLPESLVNTDFKLDMNDAGGGREEYESCDDVSCDDEAYDDELVEGERVRG